MKHSATLLLVCCWLVACASPAAVPDPPRFDIPPAPTAATSAAWESTLERVVPCIVSLRMSVPRNFDTDSARTTSGTGFIVDAEQGLILTNRHLVMPGPVVAEAVFENREEVDLQPVYRDPVHDFGFYRFDPSQVRYMELCELELAPDAARVGTEIRVVGNNAGEQISILGGTLARLDRPAPRYGAGTYNDFNTFYYQAASGTSGGSSGSPVLDIEGRVIALNAGSSRQSASSFFLPLDRVVRALELVRAGQPVPRGTLQLTLRHEPFDELARLNLDPAIEALVRGADPEERGLLVVEDIVPEGPAAGRLQPGDVLVRVDGALVTRFAPLAEILDAHVGEAITVEIQRGGRALELVLEVGDLHAITPREYLEVSRAVIHPVSYQMARSYNAPVKGLMLASRGFMFSAAGVPDNVVLLEIDGEPIPTLDALQAILERHPDGTRLTVRYAPISNLAREAVGSFRLDRSWYPMRRCVRDDATGDWPCVDSPPAPPGDETARPAPTISPLARAELLQGPAAKLAPSLVMVDFDIPYRIEGMWSSFFRGSGVVIDAAQGLVLVDRDTVPIGLGNVRLTFAGVHRVPATVEMVHPLHNLAVVRYDPADLGPLQVSAISFAPGSPGEGDRVWQVGLDSSQQVVVRETTVERIRPLTLPVPTGRPEFRDQNLDAISLSDRTPSVGGVITDSKGRVYALWASFHIAGDDNESVFRGLPAEVVQLAIAPLLAGQRGDLIEVRTLPAELDALSLAEARDLGLPQDWFERLAAHDPRRLQVLQIDRLFAGFEAAALLRPGDLVLGLGGKPVTRFFEVERAASDTLALELDVLRDGRVLQLTVPTAALPGRGVERVISWGGALLHEPHTELATQSGVAREGVYVALTWYGGPASRYGLSATRRIFEVNGEPTPTLDAFLDAVRHLEDRASARLLVRDLRDQEAMITLELDTRFWPLDELRFEGDTGWRRFTP